jgi:hypothetical protein
LPGIGAGVLTPLGDDGGFGSGLQPSNRPAASNGRGNIRSFIIISFIIG